MMHFRDSRIVCYLTRRDILAAAGLVPVEPVCFARDMMVVASRSTPLVAMNSAVSGVPALADPPLTGATSSQASWAHPTTA